MMGQIIWTNFVFHNALSAFINVVQLTDIARPMILFEQGQGI